MIKVLVLISLSSFVVANPGLLQGAPIAVATPILAPTAVSSQSRSDIINPGVITYAAAPATAVVAAPALRLATAATSRLDIRRPVLAAAPLIATGGIGYGAGVTGGLALGGVGLGLGGHGLGLAGYGYGK